MLLTLAALSLAAASPTKEGIKELRAVDRIVDARVDYVGEKPDTDFWKPAKNKGDCEDYALAKRKLLIERGWNPNDLQVLFLTAPHLGGHAVLYSVSHDAVLDNTDEDTKPTGSVPRLKTYLPRNYWTIVCVVRDISTGNRFASDRC